MAFSSPYITGVEALDSVVYNTRKIVFMNYLNFTFCAHNQSYSLDFRSSLLRAVLQSFELGEIPQVVAGTLVPRRVLVKVQLVVVLCVPPLSGW